MLHAMLFIEQLPASWFGLTRATVTPSSCLRQECDLQDLLEHEKDQELRSLATEELEQLQQQVGDVW